MPFTHQTIMETEKGNLMIGEGRNKAEWKTPLQPEPVKNYLLMSKLEEDTLDNMELIHSPSKRVEGSKFMSFAVTVGSVSMVHLFYHKLKNEHHMATHIIGAYRIFGKDHHNLQSFCDGGEHRGGDGC